MLLNDRKPAFDHVEASALVRLDLDDLSEDFGVLPLHNGDFRDGVSDLPDQPRKALWLGPQLAKLAERFSEAFAHLFPHFAKELQSEEKAEGLIEECRVIFINGDHGHAARLALEISGLIQDIVRGLDLLQRIQDRDDGPSEPEAYPETHRS